MAGFFGMFNFEKPGKGVYKDAPQKRGFFLFFEILLRKFWRISSLSLFYTLFSIPAFIIFYYLCVFVQGTFGITADPVLAHWLSIYLAVFLAAFMGTGPASMGQAYVLRNFSRENHAWVWDDFREKAMENFGKGILFFVLDIVVVTILVGAATLYFKYGNLMPMPPLMTAAFGFLAVFALFTYFMMHFFLYPLSVTMDMKAGKLLKTAFQLTMMKLPACILIFFAAFIMFALFFYLVYLNIGFLVLFVALGFSVVAFVYTFYSTSVIDEILEER